MCLGKLLTNLLLDWAKYSEKVEHNHAYAFPLGLSCILIKRKSHKNAHASLQEINFYYCPLWAQECCQNCQELASVKYGCPIVTTSQSTVKIGSSISKVYTMQCHENGPIKTIPIKVYTSPRQTRLVHSSKYNHFKFGLEVLVIPEGQIQIHVGCYWTRFDESVLIALPYLLVISFRSLTKI